MRPLRTLEAEIARRIGIVLCDFDDTITTGGRMPAASYAGLERLSQQGFKVIVVTGRPAGWCDMIARFWPVDGVVGENGAFYFRYLRDKQRMVRKFVRPESARARDRKRLAGFFARLRKDFPGLRLASDQAFRVSDIAIDMCEDVKPLRQTDALHIAAKLTKLGANVKISSIHINAWIGDFDKLATIKTMLKREFGIDAATARNRALYIGDSPNDEPMFAYFTHTVGVKNIERFAAGMEALPAYVTRGAGARGFLEVANLLNRAAATPSPDRGRNRKSSLPSRR